VLEFPVSPISPSDFFEGYVAEAYGRRGLAAAFAGRELMLGVLLEGEGGGEWLYVFANGELEVRAGSRAAAALTWIQSVEDWRGALWEGRGGIVAEKLLGLLRRGSGSSLEAAGPRAPDTGSQKLLERLAEIDGLMRTVVTGGPHGDWSTAFRFGPGEISEKADTTISIRHADAEALARRELEPLAAFLAGKIAVAGNMLLVMQLQAIVAGLGAKGDS
jgi:hypothetical protein